MRAFTAARIWFAGPSVSQADAALRAGASLSYTGAAAVLLLHGDETLIARVERGAVPLLLAAERIKIQANLVHALRRASPDAQAAAAASVLGADKTLDLAIAVEAVT